MECQQCGQAARKFGKNRNGSQRYRCGACPRTFTDESTRPADNRCVDKAKMVLCLRMLLEGNSVRSTERLAGIHRDTIMAAMVEAGENCKRFLEARIRRLLVNDVEADEIWSYVGCKEKTRRRMGYNAYVCGDAFTWIAMERNTKLILAWHLGTRAPHDCHEFAKKLNHATLYGFQLTTDAYPTYHENIRMVFGQRLDYAQLVKVYGQPQTDERQYTPAQIVDCYCKVITGDPVNERICTSHIERSNKTIRMSIRRFTRLTDGHSKKWENHEAMIALFIAYYNFSRVHSTIKQTPAMEHDLTDHVWSVEELLGAAARI